VSAVRIPERKVGDGASSPATMTALPAPWLPPSSTLEIPTVDGSSRARRRLILGTLLGAVIAVGMTLVTTQLLRPVAPPSTAIATLHGGGMVIGVRPGHSTRLIARNPSGRLVDLALAGGIQLVTRNGHALSLAGVQPGDAIIALSGTRVADTSQIWTQVSGIVAAPPEPDSRTMIVQISRSHALAVVIGSTTAINGVRRDSRSLALIELADQVQVQGVLDEQLGVITQTENVIWKSLR
jgi:hypothetical protein